MDFWNMFLCVMTSSNGNIFRVIGLLSEEFTGHWWIPLTKVSDVELCCFLWSLPWLNGWVNNREAGDMRRHRAHYDAIVMLCGASNKIQGLMGFFFNFDRTRFSKMITSYSLKSINVFFLVEAVIFWLLCDMIAFPTVPWTVWVKSIAI